MTQVRDCYYSTWKEKKNGGNTRGDFPPIVSNSFWRETEIFWREAAPPRESLVQMSEVHLLRLRHSIFNQNHCHRIDHCHIFIAIVDRLSSSSRSSPAVFSAFHSFNTK
jgi:hypothetical protein